MHPQFKPSREYVDTFGALIISAENSAEGEHHVQEVQGVRDEHHRQVRRHHVDDVGPGEEHGHHRRRRRRRAHREGPPQGQEARGDRHGRGARQAAREEAGRKEAGRQESMQKSAAVLQGLHLLRGV